MSLPYELTLSRSERSAIEWLDHRYRHGNDLHNVLTDSVVDGVELYEMSVWEAWYELKCVLTFRLSEPQAWVVQEIVEEDTELTCFSEELKFKILTFVHNIV